MTTPVQSSVAKTGQSARPEASGAALWATRLQSYGITAVALLLVVVVTIGNPAFLSATNLNNMLSQWAPAGIMAIGMTAVILAGGFDLSISATFSLCAVAAAMIGQHADPLVALAGAIAVGAAVGGVNAVLISGVGINPFVSTVGTAFVVNGLALVITKNAAFIVSNPAFGVLGAGRWHGVPYSGLLMLGLLVMFGFILDRSIYGHVIYAVGGSPLASRLSGIRVRAIVSSTYILLGALIGLAGFIGASQLSSAQATVDQHVLFDVLTIVIVGGTSLGGGIGSAWQTAVGLVIIATITNGFVLLDISPFYQDVIKGLIIVGALVLDSLFRRLGRGG